MNLGTLALLLPHSPVPLLRQFLEPLTAAMVHAQATTPQRQAHFLAQAAQESKGFTRMIESLDYRHDRLPVVWPKHFTADTALRYGRVEQDVGDVRAHPANQQMIANIAYANRMGNGSVESGDGWRYRGRGIGQLTGRDNYRRCGAALGVDLVRCPEQVAQPELACMTFAWFWLTNGINQLADAGDAVRVSAKVNGGDLGLQARLDLTDHALNIIGSTA
jgi:putative chitinase